MMWLLLTLFCSTLCFCCAEDVIPEIELKLFKDANGTTKCSGAAPLRLESLTSQPTQYRVYINSTEVIYKIIGSEYGNYSTVEVPKDVQKDAERAGYLTSFNSAETVSRNWRLQFSLYIQCPNGTPAHSLACSHTGMMINGTPKVYRTALVDCYVPVLDTIVDHIRDASPPHTKHLHSESTAATSDAIPEVKLRLFRDANGTTQCSEAKPRLLFRIGLQPRQYRVYINSIEVVYRIVGSEYGSYGTPAVGKDVHTEAGRVGYVASFNSSETQSRKWKLKFSLYIQFPNGTPAHSSACSYTSMELDGTPRIYRTVLVTCHIHVLDSIKLYRNKNAIPPAHLESKSTIATSEALEYVWFGMAAAFGFVSGAFSAAALVAGLRLRKKMRGLRATLDHTEAT